MGRFVVPRDPASLAATVSAPEPEDPAELLALEERPERPSLLAPFRARLPELLRLLPAVEQDVLRLHEMGVTERAIGALIGMTQAAVSWRIRAGTRRLQRLYSLPPILGSEGVRAELSRASVRGRDLDLATTYYLTSCATEAGRICGVTQSVARRLSTAAVRRVRAGVALEESLGLRSGLPDVLRVLEAHVDRPGWLFSPDLSENARFGDRFGRGRGGSRVGEIWVGGPPPVPPQRRRRRS